MPVQRDSRLQTNRVTPDLLGHINPFYTHHIFREGKVLYERPT